MSGYGKKALSTLLSAALVMGLVPTPALAEALDDGTDVVELEQLLEETAGEAQPAEELVAAEEQQAEPEATPTEDVAASESEPEAAPAEDVTAPESDSEATPTEDVAAPEPAATPVEQPDQSEQPEPATPAEAPEASQADPSAEATASPEAAPVLTAAADEGEQAANYLATGTWGTCPWEITEDGTLTIHPGEGASQASLPRSPWEGYANIIKSVVFAIENGERVIAPEDVSYLFCNLTQLTSVSAHGLDTSNTGYMACMFQGCRSLTSLDLSSWPGIMVVDMRSMFMSCTSLSSLDLSGWRPESLEDLEATFRNCSKLRTIKVGEWWSLSEQALNCSDTFYGCSTLVGGNGTRYSGIRTQSTYARIDRAGDPGYLTLVDTSTKVDINEATIQDLPALTFTGYPIKPALTLTYDGEELVLGTDYIASYSYGGYSSSNAGTNVVEIQGIGRFYGLTSIEYVVKGVDLKDCTVTFDAGSYTADGMPIYEYTGQAVYPKPVITLGDYTMVEDLDYELEYVGNTSEGQGAVNIIGLGNLAADGSYDFQIVRGETQSISDATVTPIPDQDWTGEAITPQITLTLGGKTLVEGVDYEVTYQDNTAPGTATVIITSVSEFYEGTTSSTFQIVARNLDYAQIAPIGDQEYTGTFVCPKITVTLNGIELVEGVDYQASYQNMYDEGTATVTATGWGDYVGSVSATYQIVPGNLENATISSIARQQIGDTAVEPKPTVRMGQRTLTLDTDYTLSYANNRQVGTATVTITGMGHYTGSVTISFEIVDTIPTIATGTWGTCPWDITEDGTLTVHSGTGANASSSQTSSPWDDYADIITSVVFVAENGQRVIAPQSMRYLFSDLEKLVSVDLTELDLSNTTNMESMFRYCSALTTIDASNLVSYQVENVRSMFEGCSSLTALDVANWDTSNVWTLDSLFRGCSSLTTVDVSRWDTSKVESLDGMFRYCSALTNVDVSNWNTAKVVSTYAMFEDCSSITTVDVSGWNTGNVSDMREMFENCKALATVDVSGWNTSSVTTLQSMFQGCSQLATLDVSAWDTSKVTVMSFVFNGCSALTGLDVSGWKTNEVTITKGMFYGCESLTALDLSRWFVELDENMAEMFYGCSSLTSLNVAGWNPCNTEDMTRMFAGCSSLTSLDVANWNVGYVQTMKGMFRDCSSLTSLNVSQWWTSSLTDLSSVFSGCSSLTSLDVSGWDTANVTNMNSAFGRCSSLEVLDLSSWDTSNVTNMGAMFGSCTNLVMIGAINWNTSQVTNAGQMFSGCSALEGIYVGDGWNMASLPLDINNRPFGGCTSLVGGNGTAYDQNHEDFDYAHIDEEGNPGYLTRAMAPAKVHIAPIPDQPYTWEMQEPELTVMLGNRQLTTDEYWAEYTDNYDIGTATVTVRIFGAGHFAGPVTTTFQIVPINLFDSDHVSVTVSDAYYTGEAVEPDITVLYDGERVYWGYGFEASFENNVEVGTATVTLTGIDSYTGTYTTTFQVLPAGGEPDPGTDPVDPADYTIVCNLPTYDPNDNLVIGLPGETITIPVEVRDADGNVVEDATFEWWLPDTDLQPQGQGTSALTVTLPSYEDQNGVSVDAYIGDESIGYLSFNLMSSEGWFDLEYRVFEDGEVSDSNWILEDTELNANVTHFITFHNMYQAWDNNTTEPFWYLEITDPTGATQTVHEGDPANTYGAFAYGGTVEGEEYPTPVLTFFSAGEYTIKAGFNHNDREVYSCQHTFKVAGPVAKSGTWGNLTWDLSDEGVLTISGQGPIDDFGGDDVAWLDQRVRAEITSVVINEGVTSIGVDAFRWCTNITSVQIPESVTSIKNYAFYYCTSLTELTLPALLTDLEAGAFFGCESLASVSVAAEGAYHTYDGALYQGTELVYYPVAAQAARLEIEEGTTSIRYDALKNNQLTQLVLPASLEQFYGDSVNLSALESYEVSPQNAAFTTDEFGVLYRTDSFNGGKVLVAYPQGSTRESYTVMEGTTELASGAFSMSTSGDSLASRNLKSIDLGESLTTIGSNCFMDCVALESLRIPASCTTIWTNFRGCVSLARFEVAEGNSVFHADENGVLFETATNTLLRFPIGSSITEYTVPEGTVAIGQGAFACDEWGYAHDTSYEWDDELETVVYTGEKAAPRSLIVPASVETLGWGAFNRAFIESFTFLNPATSFENNPVGNSLEVTPTVICYQGSTAEAWANENGFALGEHLLGQSIEDAVVTIAKKTYTGKALTPTVTVTLDGETLVNGVDYTVSTGSYIKAGTYTITITGKGLYSGTATGTFTIAKAASTIKLAAQSKTYTGKALAYSGTVTKTGSTGKVTYKYYSDAKCTTAVAAANVKTAKVYYVKATVAADANYNAATSAAAKFTINKAAHPLSLKVSKPTVEAAYATVKTKAVVTVKNVTASGVKESAKLTYAKSSGSANLTVSSTTGKVTVKKGTKAGTYTIKVKVTAAATANYKATYKIATYKIRVGYANTLKVVRKAASVTVAYSTLKSKAVTKASNITVSGAKGAVTYANASTNATAKKFTVNKTTGKVTVPKGTKKGTYQVKVKVTAAGTTTYAAKSVTVTYNIVVK